MLRAMQQWLTEARERVMWSWERLHSIWYTPLGQLTLLDLALLAGSFCLVYFTSRFLAFALSDRETAAPFLVLAAAGVSAWIGHAMAGSDGAWWGFAVGFIFGGGIVFMMERHQRRKDDLEP
jgi:hypothetical protein